MKDLGSDNWTHHKPQEQLIRAYMDECQCPFHTIPMSSIHPREGGMLKIIML